MGAMRKALLFCLFLASVSSVKDQINNINELKKCGYGSASPRHGLQLLFWFAQRVDVDQNNQFHLNFTPNQNAYGFHYFGNGEELLPPLNPGQTYYSFGKLSGPSVNTFPRYVLNYYLQRYNTITEKQERNMDRLMVSLDNKTKRRIFRVFITAHNPGSNDFNPNETYEINLELILQIRESYCNDNVIFRTTQHYDDDDEEEEKRCRQFLTETGYSSNVCTTLNKRRMKRSPYPQCNAYEGIKLEIKTTTQGYAKLIWENIPADIMKNNNYIYIDICQNTYSSDPNEDPTQVGKEYFDIHKSSGALDTSVSLNAGLQPRLRLYTSYISNALFWYGPEFDGANKVIPTRIKGLDASLQLYAGHGKACARLYIEKTFSKWEDVLYYSWVGFYKSSQDENDDYYTYQYAVKFPKINNYITDNYDVYQYNSSLTIAPGVQIRFLLDKKYNNVLAQTTPWERNQQVTSVCDKGNLWPKPSSTWSDPEFFYEPEFYDANNVLPIKIQMYDAGLQLFTKDGKACARLYIKKTFTDWDTTFYYSWVGFYTSSQEAHKYYSTYQYAVNFEKMGDGTENFDVYQFKSELAIAPGVQVRFLMDKSYDKKLVETEPWKSG